MRRLAVLLALAATSLRAADDTTLEKVVSTLEAERTRLHFPGLAVVVVHDDRVVLSKGLGLRDVERRLPITDDTLFPIGSCTKTFTAVAAAMSQDAGLLSLDDAPRRFLPWFRLVDPEADALATLRDLLSHRVGLRANADLAAEPGVLTREEYLRAAMSGKPVARLRERFQYSNSMVTAAGEAVGRANGSTWEGMIASRVLRPLRMTRSSASVWDALRDPDHATGYETGGSGPPRPIPPPDSLHAMAPAGAIASTPRDMARYLRFLLAGGVLDGKRLLSEAALGELARPHMPIGGGISYGLGWATYTWNGHTVVEHNGGARGISALVSFLPSRRVGFVLLGNTSPTSLTKIGSAGALLYPILTGETAAAPTPPPTPTPTPTPSPTATPDTRELPRVEDLLHDMAAAAGGEHNARRHASYRATYRKTYENQGVSAAVTVRAAAPAKLEIVERWSAVAKPIGTLRIATDGRDAFQETTFGQDAKLEGDELGDLRERAAFGGTVDLAKTYDRLRVLRREKLGDDDVFVLEASAGKAPPALFRVSARTSMVLSREKSGDVETYSDYRSEGGVVMPHRIEIKDAFGDTRVVMESILFDERIPEAAFLPETKRAGETPARPRN